MDEAVKNPNLEAALYHARAGRPVFPCSPKDKRPIVPKSAGGRGFKDATTDEAQVRKWWAQYPDAVPGMPTGARVGVWVLDVDSKQGKIGRETLAQLCEAFGPLPDTVETLTATGGSHMFFRHPRDGRVVPNAASQLGRGDETWGADGYPAVPFPRTQGGALKTPDLDVRGDGGYVVLPGAVMADGRAYEWEGSSDPDEGVAVAEAPDWLLALVCRDPSVSPAAGEGHKGDSQPIPEGGRNDHLYRLACSLRARGLAESVIVATLRAENHERCSPPLPDQEVVATGKSAASKPPGLSPKYERKRAEAQATRHPPTPVGGGTGHPPDEPAENSGASPAGGVRPVIKIVAGDLPAAIDDAEYHLIQAGTGIYQRGDQGLVRIASYVGVPRQGVTSRPRGAVVITPVTPEWLVDTMTRHIEWVRWDSRAQDLRRKDAPVGVARGLLARGGQWRFPYLTGFCAAPLLALDGRVIAAPGYDASTGLYLVDPPAIEPIGTTDRHCAERAGERLADLLGIGIGQEKEKFPFVSPVDYAAALAMVMTALLRPILPTAPICAVSAATPGTGKSLWVDVVSTIATGSNATVANLGKDEEETEKRIAAQLMLGEPFSFDNIEGAFRSATLCTAATQESMSVRILSQSRMARVSTRVQFYLTGNNITPLGDLPRRILLTYMDAGCERPELREFASDALERARAHRSEAIRCALIISRAYLDAGKPKVDAAPTGSFPAWDDLVRYPLIWSGLPDPRGRADDLREGDHSLQGLGLLLVAWHRTRPLPCTAAELYELIIDKTQTMGGGMEPSYPDLHDAAVQIRGDPRKWTPRDLGYLLREYQGRWMDGCRIARTGKSNRGVLWTVEKAEPGGEARIR
jgi:putative DNA primase/helicase